MQNILSTIGNTPLIRLQEIEKYYGISNRLFAKLEYFNPFGSIKDRAALQLIDDAEKEGNLLSKTIVEASSGNLGIALAAISQIKGYKCFITMPENMSEQRIKLMKKYNASIHLTDKSKGMSGAIDLAQKIADTNNAYYCNQFNNPSCVKVHFENTAKEIDQSLNKVDAIVVGIGSGGSITGIGKYFKSKDQKTKIYGVLPQSYPHNIQGIGAGFVPSILDMSVVDNIIKTDYDSCQTASKILLEKASIFAGISSCAVLSAAIEVSKRLDKKNQNIVLIFADNGERYI